MAWAEQTGAGGTRARRIGNVVAIAVLVVVVLGGYAAWRLYGATADARVAVITDGDGVEHTLPLDEDAELTITTSLGTNTVVVEDGSVYVREADCPNQDCVEQGAVSDVGEQIICLPHELVVEVAGDGQAAYDVVGQ